MIHKKFPINTIISRLYKYGHLKACKMPKSKPIVALWSSWAQLCCILIKQLYWLYDLTSEMIAPTWTVSLL